MVVLHDVAEFYVCPFLVCEGDRETDRQRNRESETERASERDRGSERATATERDRDTQRERQRENSNSKTLMLKDSSVRSIWTYLTASPCYTTDRQTFGPI